ncbi:MAG: hypothetical protein ACE5Q6_01300 [Dehalococcoidia bacterium]
MTLIYRRNESALPYGKPKDPYTKYLREFVPGSTLVAIIESRILPEVAGAVLGLRSARQKITERQRAAHGKTESVIGALDLGDKIRMSSSDGDPVVPAERLDKIFEPFLPKQWEKEPGWG